MEELSCIRRRRLSETTFHGGRPTVSTCFLSRPGVGECTRIAHINNLYNTAFWALVQEGEQTTAQAHDALRVSVFQERGEGRLC